MENLIRVDFGTNRVENTREEWIQELIQTQIESLDSMDNNDSMIFYLLKNGFIGYANMTNDELSDEIYDWLEHKYDIEETL